MKLLIDAGNSRIKWMLTDGAYYLHGSTLLISEAYNLKEQFAGLAGVNQVWVCNVAGESIAQSIREACISFASPRFIISQESQCGVHNHYSNPEQLGCDRWAALIAAWHLVQGACLVVNCGTATTIDALSSSGNFIGGLILPGVDLMQQSLRNRAVQLTTRNTEGMYMPFSLNTDDAIFSGAVQASCGAIERQYALLKLTCEKLTPGSTVSVVLSGGAATLLQNHLTIPLHIVDNIVLEGILKISQQTEIS
jgi:type III pantothenate kinase